MRGGEGCHHRLPETKEYVQGVHQETIRGPSSGGAGKHRRQDVYSLHENRKCDGVYLVENICKECDTKKKKDRSEKYKAEHQEKTCSHCGEKKGVDQFKNGIFICKVCCNAIEHKRRSQWTEERRVEENKKGREYYQKVAQDPPVVDASPLETEKKCTVCLEVHPIEQFYEHKKKGTVRAACKGCMKEMKKQYYQENKEKYNKQITEYQKERVKKDPIFHLHKQMRCRVYSALKCNSITKEKRVLEYLGCTADFFQKWMAFQLYDGMTLENYGEVWHVDHTKPIASFDLTKEDEQRACFSWLELSAVSRSKKYTKV